MSLTQESSVSGLCTWTEPPTCVAIPVSGLQWRLHGRHLYYMSLKLEGINGLDSVASSDVYEHYRGPPYGGVVVELPLNAAELVSKYHQYVVICLVWQTLSKSFTTVRN